MGEGPTGVWGAWGVLCLSNLAMPDRAMVFLALRNPWVMVFTCLWGLLGSGWPPWTHNMGTFPEEFGRFGSKSGLLRVRASGGLNARALARLQQSLDFRSNSAAGTPISAVRKSGAEVSPLQGFTGSVMPLGLPRRSSRLVSFTTPPVAVSFLTGFLPSRCLAFAKRHATMGSVMDALVSQWQRTLDLLQSSSSLVITTTPHSSAGPCLLGPGKH